MLANILKDQSVKLGELSIKLAGVFLEPEKFSMKLNEELSERDVLVKEVEEISLQLEKAIQFFNFLNYKLFFFHLMSMARTLVER